VRRSWKSASGGVARNYSCEKQDGFAGWPQRRPSFCGALSMFDNLEVKVLYSS
jgi:hypothetical protein